MSSEELIGKRQIPFIKMSIFWDMAPHNLTGKYQCFGDIRYLHFLPEDRDSRLLQNVDIFPSNNLASHSRRQ
jgi:hypothetical protein